MKKPLLSRLALFEVIRRERSLGPQVSGRTLSKRFRVSRRTVAAALASPVPPGRKPLRPRKSVLAPAHGWIDAMLREDLSAPRKQKYAIGRIDRLLMVEHGFEIASYSSVRNRVAKRCPEIEAEARDGRRHLDCTVPQVHLPGAEAEVDFADVWVRLAGVLTECRLFTLRMSYSGKAVRRVFASRGQEAFLLGHLEAFRVLGALDVAHGRTAWVDENGIANGWPINSGARLLSSQLGRRYHSLRGTVVLTGGTDPDGYVAGLTDNQIADCRNRLYALTAA